MLNELEKEIRDFIKKYTYQMKRFNIKLVEKALRVIKKSKSEELITEIDIHSIISYLEKEITAIESDFKSPYHSMKTPEPMKDYTKEELLDEAIRIIKHELPKNLRYSYLIGSSSVIRRMKYDKSGTIKKNYTKMVELKKAKVLYLIEFTRNVYKKIPSLIKSCEK